MNFPRTFLTPFQIMIDYIHNRVVLIDFGLCSFFDRKREKPITNPCGSLEYLSPEAITHSPYFATKNDAWALGVTAYLLLFGEFPYTVDDIVKRKGHPFPPKTESVPLPGNDRVRVSDEFRAILSKLLCIDASKRAPVSIMF